MTRAGDAFVSDRPWTPALIAAQTVPKANATGVPVTVYPMVAFTEPVTNIPGNVTLTAVDSGAVVPITLLGVGPSGPVTVDSAGTFVTSLTIQPAVGPKYGTTYRVSLASGMVDTDPLTPDPESEVLPAAAGAAAPERPSIQVDCADVCLARATRDRNPATRIAEPKVPSYGPS